MDWSPTDERTRAALAALLPIAEPTFSRAIRRLERGVAKLTDERDGLGADAGALMTTLVTRLGEAATALLVRTCVVELHAARLDGRLTGDTPQERFQNCAASLAGPRERARLMARYPLLEPLLVRTCAQECTATLELLRRLAADWRTLRMSFPDASSPDQLVGVDPCGDPHRGGRRVAILRFSSGRRLVYKPRPLGVEAHYQQLLEWMNAHGFTPSLRPLLIVGRGGYGWMEYVAHAPCPSAAGVERFYERLGGHLALLHLLAAFDIHEENVIAAGEHPGLVDLEALFHPEQVGGLSGRLPNPMVSSILRVGLLPMDESPGAAIGAASISCSQSRWVWKDPGTDSMRAVLEPIPPHGLAAARACPHRPFLDRGETDFRGYRESLVTGFTRAYVLLERNRAELMAETGSLRRFGEDVTRVVVRATGGYARLLDAVAHPDALRSAAASTQLLERLRCGEHGWRGAGEVIAAERSDLAGGDIPLLTSRPGSRDLWTSRGRRISGVLAESGLELAVRRCEAMGPEDLARQQWCINAGYAVVGGRSRQVSRGRARPSPPGGLCASRDRLIAHAVAIGDRVAELSYRRNSLPAWLGTVRRSGPGIIGLGPSLYDGTLGIALFLIQLGSISGERRFADLGVQTVRASLRAMDDDPECRVDLGAFTGWSGVLYVLSQAAAVTGEDWTPHLPQTLERIRSLIAADRRFDVVGGGAGAILCLLAAGQTRVGEAAVRVAREAGDHLLACHIKTESGIGWPPDNLTPPLTGLAHGGAGVALALWRLGAVLGERRFLRAAEAAVDHERSLFCETTGHWRDLRPGRATNEGHRTAWCHGAPGIGLGRLQMVGMGDEVAWRRELDAALAATSAADLLPRQSLCHGSLGNLEFLLQASATLGDARHSVALEAALARLLDHGEAYGWTSDSTPGVDSPELMTGLSGIGHGLLRLAAPARVPSVLTLAPPVPTGEVGG